MWFVYILKSLKLNKFYKGISSDLGDRIKQHVNGKSSTTKHMRPLKLIHVEICSSRSEARKLEKFFKTGFGREIIKEIE